MRVVLPNRLFLSLAALSLGGRRHPRRYLRFRQPRVRRWGGR